MGLADEVFGREKKQSLADEVFSSQSQFPTDRKQMEKQFEGEGLQQPWFDPVSAFAGGFGAGAVGSTAKSLLGKALQGVLSGGAAAVADLPAGVVTEKVASKYPKLALPTAVLTGVLAGKAVQSPAEKLLGKLMPITATKATQQATKIGKEILEEAPEEVLQKTLVQPKAGSLAYGQELPKHTLGGAGNVNLERMDAAYSVRKTVNDVAERYDITKTTRTWNEIQKEADSIGVDTVKALKDKPGSVSPEAWVQAKRDLHLDTVTRLRALQEQYVGKPLTDQDISSIRLAMEEAAGLQAQVSSNAAEAGRALNIHRKMARAQESVEGYKTILEGLGGRELNREMVEKFLALDPKNPMAAAKFVRDATRAKTGDKLYEAWINALLTSPQSHIANVTGNTLTFLFKPMMELPTTALIERGKSILTGKRPEAYFGQSSAFLRGAKDVFKDVFSDAWSEAQKAGTFGKWRGLKEGVKAAVRSFEKQLPDEIALAGKIEQTKRQAIKGKLGEVVRSPGKALQLADDLFKAINYRGELNSQAYRIATREGLKGSEKVQRIAQLLNDPSREMAAKSSHEALYRTFNNPNQIASWIMRGKNVPVLGTPMKYILPFVRTPTNIAAFALQRTPLALPWARTTEDFARIASGTMLGMFAMQLAAEGRITGGGPKDKEQKDALYNTGWQPYSFHINGKYYGFNRLEPLGSILGMSADLKNIIDGNSFDKERTTKALAAQIGLSFSKNITSKTFMVGLSNALEALDAPEQHGEKLIDQYTGSLVPSVVGAAARSIDSVLRETDTPSDVLKSRIPGLSKTLYPKRNIWGKEIQRGAGAGNAVSRMISPMYISQDTNDPVAKEMLRLGMEVSIPRKKIQGVDLTPEQYDRYAEAAGNLAREKVESYMQSENYSTRRDEVKKIAIKKIIEESRERAKRVIWPEIKDAIRTKKRQTLGLDEEVP